MSDVPPTPPPLASRATPKTVRVRRDDLTAEPSEEPTGPPRVLLWHRLGCVFVAVVALIFGSAAALACIGRDDLEPVPWAAGAVLVFVAYTLPLWWRRPKWWHWVYGLALLLPGIVPLTNPMSVVLLVFWCRPRTVRFFRVPPPSYAVAPPAPAEGTAVVVPPPGVLFPFRLLCLFGVGGCLLGMMVAVAAHAAERQPEWDVLWWLGGLAFATLLFLLGLFVRGRRPWVWWFGVVLLGLCSLSGYLTLLAVPVLAFWVRKDPRAYYGLAPQATPAPV